MWTRNESWSEEIWDAFTLDARGFVVLHLIESMINKSGTYIRIALGGPIGFVLTTRHLGYIRECGKSGTQDWPTDSSHQLTETGIKEIEDLARQSQLEILRNDLHNPEQRINTSIFLEEGERIELLTRVLVREGFLTALTGRVKAPFLEKLKEVFFSLVYPTPPRDWLC